MGQSVDNMANLALKVYLHGNRNFRSHVLSVPGAKVPPMELSLPGTFAPWYFRSMELSFPGTFAPLIFWLFTYDVVIAVKVICDVVYFIPMFVLLFA